MIRVSAIILVFLAFATIVGNAFCLLVLRKKVEGINDVVSIFMKSLAAADLLTGIFTTAPAVGPAIKGYWPFSDIFCAINAFTQNLLGTCSILSLFAVNVERYLAIGYPLHYATIASASKARIVVICIWVFAASFACLHVFRPGQVAVFHPGVSMCVSDPQDPNAEDITSIIWAVAFFILPCVITVCLFLRLYCISRAHARRIDAEESVLCQVENNTVNRFRSVEFKTSVTFFVLTLMLIVTYIPCSVMIAAESAGNDYRDKQVLRATVVCLWLSNNCINVVVYSFRNKAFRQRGKELLGMISRRGNVSNGTVSTITNGQTH